MNTLTKTLLLSLALATPIACASDGDNRGAKRGAAGGALVGLTMGALTGDAELAMKGAVAGGVTGGVAGSMSDLESDRETERTQMMADAIVGRTDTGTVAPVDASRPQSWGRLNDFVGNWACTMWGAGADGKRVNATATFTGTLATTTSVQMKLTGFDIKESDDFDGMLNGYTEFSYTPDGGYQMVNVYDTTPDAERWAGERMQGDERYSFYYVGTRQTGQLGTALSNHRMELRFLGKDVVFLETYLPGEQGEVKIQEYRLTRQ